MNFTSNLFMLLISKVLYNPYEIAKNITKISLFYLLTSSVLFSSAIAQNYNPQNYKPTGVKLSSKEVRLYHALMKYRKQNNLPKLKVSRSLTYVAQVHTWDLKNNQPQRGNCNLHSWSDKGTWSNCCGTNNNSCMQEKAQKLASYTKKCQEIVYNNRKVRPNQIIRTWKKGKESSVILNSKWKAIGLAMQGEYALVWLGEGINSKDTMYVKPKTTLLGYLDKANKALNKFTDKSKKNTTPSRTPNVNPKTRQKTASTQTNKPKSNENYKPTSQNQVSNNPNLSKEYNRDKISISYSGNVKYTVNNKPYKSINEQAYSRINLTKFARDAEKNKNSSDELEKQKVIVEQAKAKYAKTKKDEDKVKLQQEEAKLQKMGLKFAMSIQSGIKTNYTYANSSTTSHPVIFSHPDEQGKVSLIFYCLSEVGKKYYQKLRASGKRLILQAINGNTKEFGYTAAKQLEGTVAFNLDGFDLEAAIENKDYKIFNRHNDYEKSKLQNGIIHFTAIGEGYIKGYFKYTDKTTWKRTGEKRVYNYEGTFDLGGDAITFLEPTCDTGDCEGNLISEGKISKADVLKLPILAQRDGAYCDGVTMLAIKVPVKDKKVTISLKSPDTNKDIGELVPFGSKDILSSKTSCIVQSIPSKKQKYAIVGYRVPLNHPKYQGKSPIPVLIQVSVKGQNTKIRKREFTLRPTPVVLIHGVWSSPDTWKQYLEEFERLGKINEINQGSYEVATVDHRIKIKDQDKPFAVSSFDPKKDSPAIDRLIGTMELFRKRLREKRRFAVTQFQVVGHSMGGLIARARMAYTKKESPKYKRKANYNKGDFYKLITIGTPHFGTLLANFLVENKDVKTDSSYELNGQTLSQVLQRKGRPLGKAIYNLRKKDIALKNLGKSIVPCFAIIANESENGSHNSYVSNKINYVIERLKDGKATKIENILGTTNTHDGIVPLTSQKGGLVISHIRKFNDLYHTYQINKKTILNNNYKKIRTFVFELLKTSPVDKRFAKEFPAVK